jgi:hypothetical protein
LAAVKGKLDKKDLEKAANAGKGADIDKEIDDFKKEIKRIEDELAKP